MNVTIIGAGIMGLCNAWALQRLGHQVTVLEQGPVPNPLGSSVDQHRMIRLLYGDMPDYGPMLDEAFAAYELLWADIQECLYVETGVLGLCNRSGDWTDLSRAQLQDEGRSFEVLTSQEVTARYPFLSAQHASYGILTTKGGVLLAERIICALAARLADSISPHTKVVDIDLEEATVTLADATVVAADRLIITAGPWLGELVPSLARRAVSHRQVSVYLEAPTGLRTAWERAPAVVDLGGDDELYVFPPVAGTDLKVGYGSYKRPGGPDAARAVAEHEAVEIVEYFRPHLASFDEYRIVNARTCCYTITEDRRFIVEPLSERTVAASPCSGHGFKFGAVIGLKLADAIVGAEHIETIAAWAAGKSSKLRAAT